ncbi:MAG: hypothetical protein ACRD12_18660, partial [Acidimicrobiales bacterium]
ATTWPRGGRVIPPLFRIDHVLVSPQIGVLDARVGVGRSSDHRPVIADLVIPASPSTAGVALSAGRASSPTGS